MSEQPIDPEQRDQHDLPDMPAKKHGDALDDAVAGGGDGAEGAPEGGGR